MGQTPVRVFIGSGEASLIERKTLLYSLQKNCSQPLEIFIFNGTHNSIEQPGRAPIPCPMPLEIKYQNVTEFSNYRFLIPKLCNFEGRAIWIDSDTICLKDIRELFETDMGNFDFLAKENAYKHIGDGSWGLSVALYDCARTKFNLELYFDEIKRGLYTYTDLHLMNQNFLKYHPFKIGPLDPNWNSLDKLTRDTKLIHYTNLHTQPWKYTGHIYGDLWFEYFYAAKKAGFVTDKDIQLSIDRSYIRPDLVAGNAPPFIQPILNGVKYYVKASVKKLKG